MMYTVSPKQDGFTFKGTRTNLQAYIPTVN